MAKINNSLQALDKGKENKVNNPVNNNINNNDNGSDAKAYIADIKSSLNTLKEVRKFSEKNENSSIEGLVKEIITPYMEKWLENNLAEIVNKEVEKAIKILIKDPA